MNLEKILKLINMNSPDNSKDGDSEVMIGCSIDGLIKKISDYIKIALMFISKEQVENGRWLKFLE